MTLLVLFTTIYTRSDLDDPLLNTFQHKLNPLYICFNSEFNKIGENKFPMLLYE